MKIELEEHFKGLWRKGYLRKSEKDGRSRVDLFNTNKDRTTITYARYLKSVELGYIVSNEYEVDHKNNDRENDTLDNLQLLSIEDHRKKTAKENMGRNTITLECFWCNSLFDREVYNDNRKRGQKNSFCSRSCNGKYQRREQLKKSKR